MNFKKILKFIENVFGGDDDWEINIGDQYMDNRWRDTVIEIVQISKDGTDLYKIKYILINGKPAKGSDSLTVTGESYIRDRFTKIKK